MEVNTVTNEDYKRVKRSHSNPSENNRLAASFAPRANRSAASRVSRSQSTKTSCARDTRANVEKDMNDNPLEKIEMTVKMAKRSEVIKD